ncbi:uncharacterized protein LOC142983500 [Anticarsia gemmatalis]|uniref:uncharacterized protein LOC142983500 n=1 Tax=Anticarsia gemmatalis TaxID=129554 RepID=UPI003F76637C
MSEKTSKRRRRRPRRLSSVLQIRGAGYKPLDPSFPMMHMSTPVYIKSCICRGSDLNPCATHASSKQLDLTKTRKEIWQADLNPGYYSGRYRCHFIKPEGEGFFCDLCNVKLNTEKEVEMHTRDPAHLTDLNNRQRYILLPTDYRSVVPDRGWHGIKENHCLLCSANFLDEMLHRRSPIHIDNLHKWPITLGPEVTIYRKIRDHYHCITCNTMVSEDITLEHLHHDDHVQKLLNQLKIQPFYDEDIQAILTRHQLLRHSREPHRSLRSIIKYNVLMRPQNIRDTQEVYLNDAALLNTTENKFVLPRDERRQIQLEHYADQLHVTVLKDFRLSYCHVCDNTVPATRKHIDLHLQGLTHQIKLNEFKEKLRDGVKKKRLEEVIYILDRKVEMAKQTLESKISGSGKLPKQYRNEPNMKLESKVPLVQFIKTIHVYNDLPREKFLVLNGTCFVSQSFLTGIYRDLIDRSRCRPCHVHLEEADVRKHVESETHKELMEKCYMIETPLHDYIRELGPHYYDCLTCGTVAYKWEDMLQHVKTLNHKRYRDYNVEYYSGYNSTQLEAVLQMSDIIEKNPQLKCMQFLQDLIKK